LSSIRAFAVTCHAQAQLQPEPRRSSLHHSKGGVQGTS
jgi:hypothetical protein